MRKIWFERPPLPQFKEHIEASVTLLMPTPEDLFANLADAQAIVASVYQYNAELMEKAPQCLVISRTGIGYDKVDVAEATRRGIAVVIAPEGPTISTAELAITLMMAVAKNVKAIENEFRHELRHGTKRAFYGTYRAIELHGKQLGLIGFGRIARHVAAIARGMGMHVIAYDPYVSADVTGIEGIAFANSLASLLNTSDVISIHVPLTDDTHKLMNAQRFAQMKPNAIFINTARGGIVDEMALLEAIDSGHLFGAGLDVTDPEPTTPDNPLLDRDNVIITPHIASGTFAGKARIFEMAFNQAEMVTRGERPPHLINPEVWERVYKRWQATQS